MKLDENEDELSVMEAFDNLSNMAEIDLKSVADEDVDHPFTGEINWRDPRQALKNEVALKETFRVIHRYLQNMVRDKAGSLKDPEIQKGIQAIIILATEAVQKMDRFVALYPDRYQPISKLKEYQDLQKYYLQQILEQVSPGNEIPEKWEGDLNEDLEGKGVEKEGIPDLEAVRQDKHYELFFIKSETEKPYFSRQLLRHIRLMGNLDELIASVEGEDPLLKIRELLDRELHEGAKEIIRLSAPYMDEFYREGMRLKDHPYVGDLNKAVMALRMAANPKNLIENQSFKSCLEYYSDFHRFLRQAVESEEYIKLIEGRTEDHFSHVLLNLTHAFCCYFFMRVEPRKEALLLIHRLIDKGGKEPHLQIWEEMRRADQNIRSVLKQFPSGPLLKTLDSFREEEEFEGFDPLLHQNFPSELFTLIHNDFHVSLLRIPCPTNQVYIHKCDVVDEFTGFLRFYQHQTHPDRHLLINLQNRTAWEEFARCEALEKLSRQAEYSQVLTLLGLAKDTDFYHQTSDYESVSGCVVFMEQFLLQLQNGTGCGFYFPESYKMEHILSFAKKAIETVHEAFFEGKTTLSQKERLNFIEIVYQLFVLQWIEHFRVDSISFTCKDGVDTGQVQSALFYGFVRLLSDPHHWTKKDKDHLLWMFYSPALLIRERAVNEARLERGLMALEAIHEPLLRSDKKIVKAVNQLYSDLQFPLTIET